MRNYFKFLPFVFLLIAFLNQGCSSKGNRQLVSQENSRELNQCLELSDKKKYQAAVDCLEVYKSRYRGQDGSSEADLLIADNYFRNKEYLIAAEIYQDFIRENPYHSKLDYAYYRTGLSYYNKSTKKVDRDDEYLKPASENFASVVQYFPGSVYAETARDYEKESREKIASKHYYVAQYYFKSKEYLASIPRFSQILREYPGLGFDEESFYYLISAYAKTGQYDQAQQILGIFEQSFPESSWLNRAKNQAEPKS
jgi:outer membrane protein assembly factor BamD